VAAATTVLRIAALAIVAVAGLLAFRPRRRAPGAGAPPCEGDRSDRQCRGAEAVQRGALLILIRIAVYVSAAHDGAPRGTDRRNDEH
jgi:hypothetical protein